MTKEILEVIAYPVAEEEDSTSCPEVSFADVPGEVTLTESDFIISDEENVEGSRCFCCCCDYHRALMAVAIIGITLSVISMIMGLVVISTVASTSSYYTDDYMHDQSSYSVTVVVLVAVLGVSASVCALVGAIKFNLYLVFLNVVWLSRKFSSHEQFDCER